MFAIANNILEKLEKAKSLIFSGPSFKHTYLGEDFEIWNNV